MESPKKKSIAESIGVPTDFERLPNQELYKASLGFDFIFSEIDGEKRPVCIEINGDYAALMTPEDASEQEKMFMGIRSQHSVEWERKERLRQEIADKMNTGDFDVSQEMGEAVEGFMDESMQKEKLYPHAYTNPDFIAELTLNKQLQTKYIPEDYRPRLFDRDQQLTSRSGMWIVKPAGGRRGEGISILSDEEVLDQIDDIPRNFVVQEFLTPLPADNDKTSGPIKAASMRLLIDYVCDENGEIIITFERAVQRISSHPLFQENAGNLNANRDALVVSGATEGTAAVTASQEEFRLAHAAALEIIERITAEYQEHIDNTQSNT